LILKEQGGMECPLVVICRAVMLHDADKQTPQKNLHAEDMNDCKFTFYRQPEPFYYNECSCGFKRRYL
jgi:hypothetical protein